MESRWTRTALEDLLQRCDVLGACEQFVEVAATHVDLAATDAAISELRLVAEASTEMLRLQSRAYALWSQRVAAVDALLSRDLRALAEARELVESGDLDQDQ